MIKKAEATSKTHLNNIMQIAIFSLNDGRYYGINVSKIKSFEDFNKFKSIKNDTIKSVFLDGYIQYHNQVVPIINIEKWLEIYTDQSVFREYMVCEYNKYMVAFPISGINNIFNIPIEDLQQPDAMFEDVITYNAVVEIEGQETICMVLDVERLILEAFGTDEIIKGEEGTLQSDKEVLIAEDSKAARAIIESIMTETKLKYTIFNDGKGSVSSSQTLRCQDATDTRYSGISARPGNCRIFPWWSIPVCPTKGYKKRPSSRVSRSLFVREVSRLSRGFLL